MRAAGVLCALAVARLAALWGHDLVWSWWSPIAYLWQDAAVAVAFAIVDRALRRVPAAAWTLYALAVGYLAIGVPVSRVMSTPMTWTMWHAAGGALSDSVWMYATATNLSWMAAVAIAALAPLVLSLSKDERPDARGSTSSPRAGLLFASGCTIAAFGPFAVTHVDTHGLDRNAWSALAGGLTPRVTAEASAIDWRRGHDGRAPLDDLTSLRAVAANRNVILVSLESTAAQYLALYGAGGDDVMPTLSTLARSAIVFDHAYAVYPESIKGLLSTLCSVYPAVDVPVDRFAEVRCRSLASHLAAHGYRTALFHSGRFGYLGMDAVVRNRGYDVLADAGDIGGNHESSFGVDDGATVSRVLEWIDSVPRGRRFFVTYLPIAGHHPYEVADVGPFPSAGEFGRYRNALHYGDAVLGDLVRGIAARGLDRDTLWVIVGDHGEAFGQHDGNFGHTFQLYEENVHVPFVIAAPGGIAGQIRAGGAVSLIDAAPTILDLLGLPADEAYQGRSAFEHGARAALFLTDYSLGLLGLRDGSLKYIYEIDSGRSRLFDLDRDPQEAADIANLRRDDVREFRDRLRGWSAAQAARLQSGSPTRDPF